MGHVINRQSQAFSCNSGNNCTRNRHYCTRLHLVQLAVTARVIIPELHSKACDSTWEEIQENLPNAITAKTFSGRFFVSIVTKAPIREPAKSIVWRACDTRKKSLHKISCTKINVSMHNLPVLSVRRCEWWGLVSPRAILSGPVAPGTAWGGRGPEMQLGTIFFWEEFSGGDFDAAYEFISGDCPGSQLAGQQRCIYTYSSPSIKLDDFFRFFFISR